MKDHPEIYHTPFSAIVVRLCWMVFGSIILILVALTVAFGSFQDFLTAGLIYWGNVLGMIVVRYIDIRCLRGETVDCQPATIRDWKRYGTFLLIASAIIWVLVWTVQGVIVR